MFGCRWSRYRRISLTPRLENAFFIVIRFCRRCIIAAQNPARFISPFNASKSGAAAIEFAVVAPVFIMLVMTSIGYGMYLSTAQAVQQLVSDAARASIAGLSNAEREALVLSYVKNSTFESVLIDPENLKIRAVQDASNADQFTVEVAYDASSLQIWTLYAFPLPESEIIRKVTIRMGGI